MTTDKITMFRARNRTWRRALTRVHVDRVSDKYVWIGGERVTRLSGGTAIAHEFGVVKQWLLEQLVLELASHQKKCEDLLKRIEDIEATNESDIPEDNSRY